MSRKYRKQLGHAWLVMRSLGEVLVMGSHWLLADTELSPRHVFDVCKESP